MQTKNPFILPLLAIFGLLSAGGASAQIFTNLFSFEYSSQAFGFPDGAQPSGLMQGSDGNFYGTTFTYGANSLGAANGLGTVFKISANGELTTLHTFTGTTDGAYPTAAPVQGRDGNFYGTTSDGGTNNLGTVFKTSVNGVLTSLSSFTGTNGAMPFAGLAQGSDGNFYGTTSGGGTNNLGTVFKISTSGVLTSLYSFAGTNDGASPQGALAQGSDANFYGTTSGGGTNNLGTVFKISTNGILTNLCSFPGGSFGEKPYATLAEGRDGNFYGTTSGGFTDGYGSIFRLTFVPEPPELTIVGYGTDVILTWPTNAVGFNATSFILEFATNFDSPTVWKTNSTARIIIGGQNVVINPITGSQMFYRLFSD